MTIHMEPINIVVSQIKRQLSLYPVLTIILHFASNIVELFPCFLQSCISAIHHFMCFINQLCMCIQFVANQETQLPLPSDGV